MGLAHFFAFFSIMLWSSQFEGEYSFTGNASLGDSIGAVER